MRAPTGCAHAGYAALHVRDRLSPGDHDPLQTKSIRAMDGNRHRTLSAHLIGIFWVSLHAMIAPRTERSSCCRDTGPHLPPQSKVPEAKVVYGYVTDNSGVGECGKMGLFHPCGRGTSSWRRLCCFTNFSWLLSCWSAS